MKSTKALAVALVLLLLLNNFSAAGFNELVIRLGYLPSVVKSLPGVKPPPTGETVVKCAPATVKAKDGFIPGSVVDSVIQKAAEFYKIDPYAICAIIKRESGFDATSLGGDYEVGLMQILPATGRSECGLESNQLWNVDANVRCGAKVLAKYLRLCDNNLFYGFCAYNAGPGNVHCTERAGDRMVCPVSSGKAKPYAYAKGVSQNLDYYERIA